MGLWGTVRHEVRGASRALRYDLRKSGRGGRVGVLLVVAATLAISTVAVLIGTSNALGQGEEERRSASSITGRINTDDDLTTAELTEQDHDGDGRPDGPGRPSAGTMPPVDPDATAPTRNPGESRSPDASGGSSDPGDRPEESWTQPGPSESPSGSATPSQSPSPTPSESPSPTPSESPSSTPSGGPDPS